jgi:hypothetical protein
MERISGTVFLSANGRTLPLVGNFEYSSADEIREVKTGMDTVHGYSAKPKPNFIAGTVRDMGGLTVAELNAMTDVNLFAALANGKNVNGAEMVQVGEISAKSEEGEIEVRWEGSPGSVTEVPA